jgi:hypothetical protein
MATLGLQHPSQSCSATAGRCDFASDPVMQSNPVKPVAAMNDALDRPQVYYGMSAELNKRIEAKPVREFSQRIISRKLL